MILWLPTRRHNQPPPPPPPAGRINIQNMFTASPQGVHNVIFFSNLFGNITAGIYSRAHYRRGIQSRDKIPDAGIALVAHSLESTWDLSHQFNSTCSCSTVWEGYFTVGGSCSDGPGVMIRYSGYWGRRGYSRVIEVSQNSFSGSFCSLVVFAWICVSRLSRMYRMCRVSIACVRV